MKRNAQKQATAQAAPSPEVAALRAQLAQVRALAGNLVQLATANGDVLRDSPLAAGFVLQVEELAGRIEEVARG